MSQPKRDIEYLVIGQILAPRGVRGELKVRIESDDPKRFLALEIVYVGASHKPMHIHRARLFKGMALVQVDEITTANAAEDLRGQYLYVAAEYALPLDDNEYYHHQLEGLRVVTEAGETLGTLHEIIVTGANDVYVVRGDRGDVLLPAIKDVIQNVDIQAGIMTVRLIDGLLDG